VIWRQNDALSLYASVGGVRREPTRDDMFVGADNLDASNAGSILPFDHVRPEQVVDYEVGANWTRGAWRASANLFAMEFREEIAPVGAVSLTGSQLRVNVGSSHRRGVEGEVHWQATPRLVLDGTLAVTDARIDHFTDEVSQVTYRNVRSRLTPSLVTTQRVLWQVGYGVSLLGDVRTVSESPLTNTGDRAAVVPAYTLADAAVSWEYRGTALTVRVNNVFDRLAYGGGYESGGTNYVFPFATRHLMVDLRRRF
jgi:iron complex outermembrane receptor protein